MLAFKEQIHSRPRLWVATLVLVVRGGTDDGKAVGLLYAGGAGVTVANPIGPVLSAFGVTIDGGP